MTESLENMMQNYTSSLIDRLKDTKRTADRTDDPYQKGHACGYYMALTMLVIRMKSHGVEPTT